MNYRESDKIGVVGKPQCPKCLNGLQNAQVYGMENGWRCASCKGVWVFTGKLPKVKKL